MIYGLGSFSNDLGYFDQTMIVTFLVIFPIGVLGIFLTNIIKKKKHNKINFFSYLIIYIAVIYIYLTYF
jgi:hypothetical protein